MSTEDYDENELESYELTRQDESLLRAAKSLLVKVIRAEQTRPAEIVSAAKLLHALSRLPRVTGDLDAHVSVCSPHRMFGDIRTCHWWDVTLVDGNLSLSSGGHFYRPSTGGDSFTTMTWQAYPGETADFSDYRDSLRIVPDVCSYEDGVARVDFAAGGFSITVTDCDNPLLDETEDDVDSEDEFEVEDEEDEEKDDEEESVVRPALAVTPVDEAEMALAQMISPAAVELHPADYAAGAEECDFCQRSFDSCGLFVDGKLRGEFSWANMCAACFARNGEGIGWGRGQIFARQANGDWRLVAGFPPTRAAEI